MVADEGMSIEYDPAYEYVDGGAIHPEWAGQQVPVPPTWVRTWAKAPEAYAHASLAKELAPRFKAETRDLLVSYVKDWPTVRKNGHDLIIAGVGAYTKKRYLAYAVLNEIVRNYATSSALSSEWLNCANVQWLIEQRDAHSPDYFQLRNKALNAKLLLVNDPSDSTGTPEVVRYIANIYDHRVDHRLPTIFTLDFNLRDESNWRGVRKALGSRVTEFLMNNHGPYLVHI